MKLTAKKEDLERALKIGSTTVANSGDELRAHYLFRYRNGKMEVLGNDERLLGSVVLECEVEGASDNPDENRFTVEADRINRWLSASPKGNVSLRLKDGKVIAQAALGKVTFRSLDPARFPYWESRLEAATFTGKISASRLHRILKHAQLFMSNNEAQDPEICSCEFKDNGFLYATDAASATIIRVAGMEKSNARMTKKKDISSYLRFLEAHSEDEIEFWEHDQCLFLKTSSGNLFGQTKWKYDFPDIDLGSAFEDAHHWWTFSREEMISVIGFLTPSAVRDRYQIHFKLDGVGNINVSLTSAAGGKVEIPVNCKESKSVADCVPLPQGGFPLSYEYLKSVLKGLSGEFVTMASSQLLNDAGDPAGGYCSFKQEVEGDQYLVVLGWYEEQ